MIPTTFHRVWLPLPGGDREPVPEEYELHWKHLQALHPDWTFRSWEDPDELDWLQNRRLFDAFPARQQSYAFRADLVRYEVLRRFGGVYVDTDVEPLRNFEPLLDDPRPFIAWCSDDELDPAVIASPPDHPAIRYLVDGLADVRPTAISPPGTTGPRYVTPRWRARNDVRRLPPVTFFPFHWDHMEQDEPPWPDRSFAVHHWAAGWKPETRRTPRDPVLHGRARQRTHGPQGL